MSCIKQETKTFLINGNVGLKYTNYVVQDTFPYNSAIKYKHIQTDSFDIKCFQREQKLNEIKGDLLLYILQKYDFANNEYHRKLGCLKDTGILSDPITTKVFVVGCIDIQKGVRSTLYLYRNNWDQLLFLINSINNSPKSFIELSAGSLLGFNSKTYLNNKTFISVRYPDSSTIYYYFPTELISHLTNENKNIEALVYSKFKIINDGSIQFANSH